MFMGQAAHRIFKPNSQAIISQFKHLKTELSPCYVSYLFHNWPHPFTFSSFKKYNSFLMEITNLPVFSLRRFEIYYNLIFGLKLFSFLMHFQPTITL